MDKLTDIAIGTFATRDYYKEHFADCNLSDNHKKSKSCSALTEFFMYITYHNFIAEGLAASYPCFCICQIVVHYIVRGNATTGNKYQKRIDFFNTDVASNMIDDVTEIMNNLCKKSGNDERKNI